MDHLLEMRNLSIDLHRGRRTPPVKLVEGIDLNIDKKQNFGIVGESGCGKSITCSSIMGLLSFPFPWARGAASASSGRTEARLSCSPFPKSRCSSCGARRSP